MLRRRIDPEAIRLHMAGRTAYAVGKEARVSDWTILRWLKGERSEVTYKTLGPLEAFADWAGVRVDDLLLPDPWAEKVNRAREAVK